MIIRITKILFFFLIFPVMMCFSFDRVYAATNPNQPNVVTEGTITIINTDAGTKKPIKNTQYQLFDVNTKKVVQVLSTNNQGKAVSKPLPIGSKYKLKQLKAVLPFKVSSKEFLIEVKTANSDIRQTNRVFSYIKKYKYLSNGRFDVKKVYIPVKSLRQKPQLPNGCEITSLTAVLNYYHYNVSKTKMSDQYLPKKPFYFKKGKRYGPDPYKYFAGNPRSRHGFFSYSPPIVKAANSYMKKVKGTYIAKDLRGRKKDVVLDQLDKGVPVVIWVTLDLSKPKIKYGWYLSGTKKYFRAPVNLHAVVLNGYDDKYVYIMNPLKGHVKYDSKKFFSSYKALGSHAMMVAPK
ncbi:C39 family peptidase [Neobacillus cucumis]|uniref:C39 family peptidase n=1 Tax=Neobacillus cucumis TaxID=1740721 RepID=UPI0018DFC3A1|nr:C39 family peptidase [Neobacillus cucumis]MBI0576917.1 C39 family peptidase [Neobacillus cucumis]